VCESSLVLFFTTDEETMLKRLLVRGKTSGRDDDNEATIKKRFGVFECFIGASPLSQPIHTYSHLQRGNDASNQAL
jgi:hypothetical protein